jgi:CheY-like chemotaxis protein
MPEAQAGPYVVIKVRDTGTGIPADVVDKIFDPFFTTKEIGKGTGLGLSTLLTIVKQHHGFVRVSSEVGVGTEFRVYLPAQTEEREARPEAEADAVPRGHGELVLVVDDESAIRELIRQSLVAYGYRVLLASGGAEAVSLYAQRADEVAVVIADLMMPGLDGAATMQVLLKMNPGVKIIAMSGRASSHDNLPAAEPPIRFLQKPFSSEPLLRMLHDVLSGASGSGAPRLFE